MLFSFYFKFIVLERSSPPLLGLGPGLGSASSFSTLFWLFFSSIQFQMYVFNFERYSCKFFWLIFVFFKQRWGKNILGVKFSGRVMEVEFSFIFFKFLRIGHSWMYFRKSLPDIFLLWERSIFCKEDLKDKMRSWRADLVLVILVSMSWF